MPNSLQILVSLFFVFGDLGCVIFFTNFDWKVKIWIKLTLYPWLLSVSAFQWQMQVRICNFSSGIQLQACILLALFQQFLLLRGKPLHKKEEKLRTQHLHHKLRLWVYLHTHYTCKWLIQLKYCKVSFSLFIKFMIIDYSTNLEFLNLCSIYLVY